MTDSLKEPLVSQEEPVLNGQSKHSSEGDDAAVVLWTPEWFWRELKTQLIVALPMVCVNVLQFSVNVASTMFVGHLGQLELASASIASSLGGVTGTALLMGMASSLETLCGQAYGAKQYHMLGIYLQRAMLVLYITSIPITVVWWNMGWILRAIGQDHSIADLAGLYAQWLIPTLLAYASLQPLVKFLQTQSIVLPMALMSLTTLAIHIPVCWLIIYKLGVGVRGAAMANGFSNWLNVALLALYVKFSPKFKKTWTGFSKQAFYDLGDFFKLAIPSAVMLCLEYWSMEILVLASGLLPNPTLETSTLSICLNYLVLMYMIPFGLSASVSTRVSNELGAGNPQVARASVTVGVGMAALEGGIMAILLVTVLRRICGQAFTDSVEVIEYVSHCMPLLASIVFMDSVQGSLSGVARGCGWQALGAYTNLGAFYVLGLPLGIVLAFVLHFNGIGLWIGIICGMAVKTVLLVFITLFTDWEKQALKARGRVYRSLSGRLPM